MLGTRRWSLFAAPVLLLLTLCAWAFSSPVGSSPDDDFHLTSIWCATGDADRCVHEPGSGEAVVPGAIVSASCYSFDPDESAACQDEYDFTGAPDRTTERSNFYGAYPPVFHAVLSVFVGDDIQVSVLAMRVFLAIVFTAFATALFVLLPRVRRQSLVWGWLLTTVPLGLFLLAATNPSAWAVAGVGFGGLALAGYYESRGWRRVGLGAIVVLSAVLAAGSRGDASLYFVIAMAAAVVLTIHRTRAHLLASILPVAVAIFCALMFRVSRPAEDVTEGVEPDAGIAAILARVLPTAYDVPGIWTGIFGDGWGLGWLDTSMPAVVWLGALGCFLGAGIVAAGRMDSRKAIVLLGGVAVLWLLPTAVLVLADESVGENMQPRYLLPLIVLFAWVLFWSPDGRPIRFTRPQLVLVGATLAVAQAVALHLNIGRYIRGFDDLGANLDAGAEWWWDAGLSPMGVWIVGTLAYAGLLAALLTSPDVSGRLPLTTGDPSAPEADRDDAVVPVR